MTAPIFIQHGGRLSGLGAEDMDRGTKSTSLLASHSDVTADRTWIKAGPPTLPDLTASLSPSGVRAMSAVSLGIGGLIGFGAYKLFKSGHPVWGTVVGLIAASSVSSGAYGLASGEKW